MKNLKDIKQVAHYWANRVRDEGKASSLWFRGDTLHSYAEPIAKLLPDGTSLHTTQKWSVTTSAHQSLALSAVAYSRSVYCRRVQDSPATNMAYAREQISRTLACSALGPSDHKKDGTPSARGQARVAKLKAEALAIADEANKYLEACQRNDLGSGVIAIDTSNLEGVRAELVRQKELALEESCRRAARAAEAAREHLVAWRAGNADRGHFQLHNLPVALRLGTSRGTHHTGGLLPDRGSEGKQVIQTSHGAEIPVKDAKHLWPLLLRIRATGVEWMPEPTAKERRLGVYTLNAVRADGGIRVGCHEIAFSEMAAMAEQLGLTEKETA